MSTSKELPTVLLITKDLFQIAFFKKLLKKTFYVVELEEEESWIEWIKDPSLALILINEKTLEAPLLNLCRHIRKFTLPSLPILVISNQLQDSFLSKAKEVGVFDTIQEPFLESTVLQQIERSLATKTVQKKIKQITSKLKPPLSIPKNTRLFLEKMLIRASSLEKISEAKETASPLGVLIIQLDLMDRLHHDLGKSSMHLVLKEITAILQAKLRHYDTLIIEGEGKYLLLLPKTSCKAAKVLAEDLRQEISTTTIHTPVRQVLATVSIGVLSFDQEVLGSEEEIYQFGLCLEKLKKSLQKAQKTGNTIIST